MDVGISMVFRTGWPLACLTKDSSSFLSAWGRSRDVMLLLYIMVLYFSMQTSPYS